MIPSGIEPATFRLVAHYLNQLCYRVHPFSGTEGKFRYANRGQDGTLISFICCYTSVHGIKFYKAYLHEVS